MCQSEACTEPTREVSWWLVPLQVVARYALQSVTLWICIAGREDPSQCTKDALNELMNHMYNKIIRRFGAAQYLWFHPTPCVLVPEPLSFQHGHTVHMCIWLSTLPRPVLVAYPVLYTSYCSTGQPWVPRKHDRPRPACLSRGTRRHFLRDLVNLFQRRPCEAKLAQTSSQSKNRHHDAGGQRRSHVHQYRRLEVSYYMPMRSARKFFLAVQCPRMPVHLFHNVLQTDPFHLLRLSFSSWSHFRGPAIVHRPAIFKTNLQRSRGCGTPWKLGGSDLDSLVRRGWQKV